VKPLHPAQIIAEYEAAYRAGNEGCDPWWDIEYVRGWFCFMQDDPDHGPVCFARYRGAQIVHMTAQLRQRVQSQKADQ
jgi:hypothetical protein